MYNSVPTEKHGLVVPEFEEESDNDNDDDSSTTGLSASARRPSVWTMFGTKSTASKNSGSQRSMISIDSEGMVEDGLEPLWQGSSISMGAQQTETVNITDAGYGTDKSSQGIIRG